MHDYRIVLRKAWEELMKEDWYSANKDLACIQREKAIRTSQRNWARLSSGMTTARERRKTVTRYRRGRR
jgi:hypothetical protein